MSAAHTQAVYAAPGTSNVTVAAHELVLDYWRALEMVQKQGVPDGDPNHPDGGAQLSTLTEGSGSQYPWDRPAAQEGVHSVYVGLFSVRKAFERINRLNNYSPEVVESTRSNFALCSLRVHSDRGYETGSFKLSTAAWMIGRLLSGSSLSDGFKREEKEFRAYAEKLLCCSLSDVSSHLHTLTEYLITHLSLTDLYVARDIRHRVASHYGTNVSTRTVGSRVAGLNSPYLEEIERVRKCLGASRRENELPPALASYLGVARTLFRMDLSSAEGQDLSAHALLPSYASQLKWPGETDYLSKSEQLAANLIRRELRDSAGIQAIAVPQGASEHRLIREVAMESLMSRADSLVSFPRTSLAFSSATCAEVRRGEPQWKLNAHLRGTGVAIAVHNARDVSTIASHLSLSVDRSETDNLLEEFVRYGLQAEIVGVESSQGRGRLLSRLRELLVRSELDQEDREVKLAQWSNACERYRAAKLKVLACLVEVQGVSSSLKALSRQRNLITGVGRSIKHIEGVMTGLASRLADGDTVEIESLEREQAELQGVLQLLESFSWSRGGLLGFFRGGRSDESQRKALRARCTEIAEQLGEHHKRMKASADAVAAERVGLDRLTAELSELESEFCSLASQLESACDSYSLKYLHSWLRGERVDELDTELEPAWRIAGLDEAREELLYESLRLQAVFMRHESARVLANLRSAVQHIERVGQESMSSEQVSNAWAVLQLAAPVMVMTNDAMVRVCRALGSEGFDWVVQCSAGKAQPWEIAGAVYRGRRVVVLGDQHDFQCGVIAHKQIRRMLAYQVGIGVEQAECSVSAQQRAEECSLYGVLRRTVSGDEWAGIPIRAVETVAEPMLSLLERSVYGQRLQSRTFQMDLLDDYDSGWIDIRGESRGDYVPHEGRALVRLVDILLARGVPASEISVVSPSHRARTELKKLLLGAHGLRITGLDCIPSESSEYVILVLGGGSVEWREWASSSAALIALPASRARKGLFVIGDRSCWSRRAVMQAASELLPSLSVDIVAAEPVVPAATPVTRYQRNESLIALGVFGFNASSPANCRKQTEKKSVSATGRA